MKNSKGSYIAYRLSDHSSNELKAFLCSSGVPCDQLADLHVTVIYSRKDHSEQYTPEPNAFHMAFPESYALFDGEQEGRACLVLKLRCPSLVRRHHQLMETLDATYDYPVYHPHVTIAQDVPKDLFLPRLPLFQNGLMLVNEYHEELNVNAWSEQPEAVPIAEVLADPSHPFHEGVSEVMEKLEKGEIQLCAPFPGMDEPWPEEKKQELIAVLDRIIDRTGENDVVHEEPTSNDAAGEPDRQEGNVEENAQQDLREEPQDSEEQPEEEQLTVEPGGAAFPITEIGPVVENIPMASEPEPAPENPIVVVQEQPKQVEMRGLTIQRKVKKKR